MGKIFIGNKIIPKNPVKELIKCCSCRKYYDFKGNIFGHKKDNILVCPYCGLKHKIDFKLFDNRIDNLIKIDRLNLVDIDIGSAATDRGTATYLPMYTIISKENPANASGTIKSVEMWVDTAILGLKIGIFYNTGGLNFATRDWVLIGDVSVGYHKFSVNLNVETGDYIGHYSLSGYLDCDNSGEGYWYLWHGDIPVSEEFELNLDRTVSLYGTSVTEFEYVGTGSLTYSGTATTIIGFTYAGSGELTYSGTATITIGFTYVGSGELTYSGEAGQSYTYNFSYIASGSFVTSGSGSYYYEAPDWEYAGSGTYNFSGVGLYSLGLFYIGVGELVYSGSAVAQVYSRHYLYAGSGVFAYLGDAVHRYITFWSKVIREKEDGTKVEKEKDDWDKVDREKRDWEKEDRG